MAVLRQRLKIAELLQRQVGHQRPLSGGSEKQTLPDPIPLVKMLPQGSLVARAALPARHDPR
jgi:hypothetical protein